MITSKKYMLFRNRSSFKVIITTCEFTGISVSQDFGTYQTDTKLHFLITCTSDEDLLECIFKLRDDIPLAKEAKSSELNNQDSKYTLDLTLHDSMTTISTMNDPYSLFSPSFLFLDYEPDMEKASLELIFEIQ